MEKVIRICEITGRMTVVATNLTTEQAKALVREKAKADEIKNATTQYYFNVGERVFHDKLGVGHIADVIQIGESTMYTIDFGKMGKKAMDAAYAHLKKF